MIELNYENVKNEFIKFLGEQENVVLSTCSQNKVTSRMMCFANEGFIIYLLTGKRSYKCKQINENQNVSLCIGNMQIEGKARILGNPMKEENADVSRIFKGKHLEYYERFAHFKSATFIEVKCEYLKQWKMEAGRDYFYCLDVIKGKAVKHS